MIDKNLSDSNQVLELGDTKRGVKLYFAYIGGFLPSIILSIITILVLFLIDTMPKMSMVYFDVAEDIVSAEK